ncbi:MAG: OmpA family protein [Bacteroidales bacterium]
MKIRTIMAGMTAACSLALLAGLTPAQADDVKMYKTAPSVEELEKVLGSGAGAKPKAKTRSIVFGDESAPAPAQQAEPASYQPPPPPSQAEPASAPSRAEPAPAPARQQAAHKQAAPAPAKAPPAQRVSAPPPAQTQVEVSEKAVGFPINFDLGSANIRPDSRPFLDAIAGLMRKDTSIRLLIEGHTDATGDYVKNMELSRARAASVLAYLMANYGIEPTRLQAVGKGPTEPLDPSQPYSGENRRVQFRVIGG